MAIDMVQLAALINAQGPKKETPQEELERMELEQLRQSRAEEDMFRPEYYRQLGYRVGIDANGKQVLIPLTEEERLAGMTPGEKSNYLMQKMANERAMKAMQGKLDIDPSVEEDIRREESIAKEGLYRQLGEGAEQTTAGQRRLAELAAKANALRYNVRHGELTSSEAISENRGNRMADIAGRYGSMSDPTGTIGATRDFYGDKQRDTAMMIDFLTNARESAGRRYRGKGYQSGFSSMMSAMGNADFGD